MIQVNEDMSLWIGIVGQRVKWGSILWSQKKTKGKFLRYGYYNSRWHCIEAREDGGADLLCKTRLGVQKLVVGDMIGESENMMSRWKVGESMCHACIRRLTKHYEVSNVKVERMRLVMRSLRARALQVGMATSDVEAMEADKIIREGLGID